MSGHLHLIIFLSLSTFCLTVVESKNFVPGDPCLFTPGCDPSSTFLNCKPTRHHNGSLSYNCECREGAQFDAVSGQCRLKKGQPCGQWAPLKGQQCEPSSICKDFDAYTSVCVQGPPKLPSPPWSPGLPNSYCTWEENGHNGAGAVECESFRTFLICVGRQRQGYCTCDKDAVYDEDLKRCVLKLDEPCFLDDVDFPAQPCARGSECKIKKSDQHDGGKGDSSLLLTSKLTFQMTCGCKPDTVADTHYFVQDRKCQSIFGAPCNTTDHGDCLATQFLKCGLDHVCGCGPDATYDPESLQCVLNYRATCSMSDIAVTEEGQEVVVKTPKCGKGSECKGHIGVNKCYCKAGHVPVGGKCVATVREPCDTNSDCDPESFLTCSATSSTSDSDGGICQCCDGSESMVCGASGKCRCRWSLDPYGDCRPTGHVCRVPGVSPHETDCGQYHVCEFDQQGQLRAYNFSCPVKTVLCPEKDWTCNDDDYCTYRQAGYTHSFFYGEYYACDMRTVWCQKSASCEDPRECPCVIKRKAVVVRHDPSYL